MAAQICNHVLNITCFHSLQNYELDILIKIFNQRKRQTTKLVYSVTLRRFPFVLMLTCTVLICANFLHRYVLHRFCCAKMCGTDLLFFHISHSFNQQLFFLQYL